MVDHRDNGHSFKPLIGMPSARDKSQRYYGLPVFIQNQTYLRAVAQAGGAPITIPLHLDETTLRVIFDRLDGLFLPGGEDMDPASYGQGQHELLGAVDPERDRVERQRARWAVESEKPLLAVCRGLQVLNVAQGGSLFQDIRAEREGSIKHDYFPPQFERARISHPVAFERASYLAGLFGARTEVNSMHHQALRALGRRCRAVAWAPDGVVEGLEVADHPFALAVQWHPEELTEDRTRAGNGRLFAAFVDRCRQRLVGNGLHGPSPMIIPRQLSQVALG